jgi:urease accessory protein
MPRITSVLPAEQAATARASDTVILSFAERRAQFGSIVGVSGTRYQLALPAPTMLRMGDFLTLDDARLIEVVAEAEPLIEVRGADLDALVRLAWHLGDRHVAVEILPNRLRLRRDPAIELVLGELGARVVAIEAPFNPEGGAYLAASAPRPHRHGHHHHAADRPPPE